MSLYTKLRVFALLLIATALPANAAPNTAHIADFDHIAKSYHVVRNGNTLPVKLNMDLQDSDRIYADAPGAVLIVEYTSKAKDRATFGKPVDINGATKTATVRSNIWNLLWQRASDEHDRRITTGTKGDNDPLELLMPGLSDGTARLATGERHFMLSWSGGIGPFTIVLSNAKGPVYSNTSIYRNLIVFSQTTAFMPGRYEIEITDGSHATARGSFTVTAKGIPKTAAVEPDPVARSITNAANLAASGDRSLYYEAYLRLFDAINGPDHEGDPVAVALALWISDGAPAE